jgi:hypothetical protein
MENGRWWDSQEEGSYNEPGSRESWGPTIPVEDLPMTEGPPSRPPPLKGSHHFPIPYTSTFVGTKIMLLPCICKASQFSKPSHNQYLNKPSNNLWDRVISILEKH